jgi:hypothetical protein
MINQAFTFLATELTQSYCLDIELNPVSTYLPIVIVL